MTEQINDTSPRTPLELFHFNLAAAGMVTGISGVVLSSLTVTALGFVLIAWAAVYFAVVARLN